jgi:hypothetical protein
MSDEEIQNKRKQLQEQLVRGFACDIVDEEVEKKMSLMFENDISSKGKRLIRKVDNFYPYHIIKSGIKETYTKEQTLTFFINKNISIKGKITNIIEDGLIELPLLTKATKIDKRKDGVEDTIRQLFCFGDKIDREWTHEEVLTGKFFLYRMIAKNGDNQESFMVISDIKLSLEEYTIEGMMLDLEDYSDVSKYAKLMKKNHVIFVNSAKPSRIVFKDSSELFNVLDENKITEDIFYKYLFSIKQEDSRMYFKHPRYFERFIASCLISARYDSSPYPAHPLVIGKQGGGKSKAQEAIFEKMQEVVPIVEGAGSTMKSLIPSFKGETTKAGAMIESNRICFVDEFFRILMRVEKDERESQLTHLNPLLEHKMRRFASGNNFLDGQMTSKLFAVTNPVFGTSNMQMLCNKLDNSFVSRVIVWFQDEEHYKQVTSTNESDLEIIYGQFDNNLLLSIYDYCNSFKIRFDTKKLNEIYLSGARFISDMQENVRGVYSSRYKHHIACLLDGITKLRCLFERDGSFEAKQEDYDNLKQIWDIMLIGWKNGIKNDRFDFGHNKEDRFY